MSIRYLGTGSPLVCLAGGPGRSAVYLEDLGGLSQHHQLVLPDARGTAGSDDAMDDDGWSVDAISDDIEPGTSEERTPCRQGTCGAAANVRRPG